MAQEIYGEIFIKEYEQIDKDRDTNLSFFTL